MDTIREVVFTGYANPDQDDLGETSRLLNAEADLWLQGTRGTETETSKQRRMLLEGEQVKGEDGHTLGSLLKYSLVLTYVTGKEQAVEVWQESVYVLEHQFRLLKITKIRELERLAERWKEVHRSPGNRCKYEIVSECESISKCRMRLNMAYRLTYTIFYRELTTISSLTA